MAPRKPRRPRREWVWLIGTSPRDGWSVGPQPTCHGAGTVSDARGRFIPEGIWRAGSVSDRRLATGKRPGLAPFAINCRLFEAKTSAPEGRQLIAKGASP